MLQNVDTESRLSDHETVSFEVLNHFWLNLFIKINLSPGIS